MGKLQINLFTFMAFAIRHDVFTQCIIHFTDNAALNEIQIIIRYFVKVKLKITINSVVKSFYDYKNILKFVC